MEEIVKCEVCGSKELIPVLDLGKHPLCDDLVPIGDSRVCNEYPIEIVFCKHCITAHQKYQVPKETLFTKSYHYRARMTGSVLTGMSDLVNSCEQRFGNLSGKKVVDIGCNDGSLLNFFEEKGAITMGVEPTGAALDSHHRTLNMYFDRTASQQILDQFGKPDFITFTNVFAHIEHLNDLLDNLRPLFHDGTVLVIENHYLGDVLKRSQFDTFYHEHPRTYSLKSFEVIAKNLGLNVLDAQFVSRYGGNIRVFIGKGESRYAPVDESDFFDRLQAMQGEVREWIEKTRSIIDDLVRKHGKLPAKAFPGRAAILMKLLGVDEEQIKAVYEIKGSIKVQHYVPGTRIPILPEADLFAGRLDGPILNLAWHIPDEVRANLASHGYTGQVYDIK